MSQPSSVLPVVFYLLFVDAHERLSSVIEVIDTAVCGRLSRDRVCEVWRVEMCAKGG